MSTKKLASAAKMLQTALEHISKPHFERARLPSRNLDKTRLGRSLALPVLKLSLVLCAALSLAGCRENRQNTTVDDPTGTYRLISVDGSELPASVSHDGVLLRVQSGTFVINADGTCSSRVTFGPQSEAEATREVNATYTREGSNLMMQWEGAGKTVGTVDGDRFTMNNEGMLFAYEK